jgi:hypothetical protein
MLHNPTALPQFAFVCISTFKCKAGIQSNIFSGLCKFATLFFWCIAQYNIDALFYTQIN